MRIAMVDSFDVISSSRPARADQDANPRYSLHFDHRDCTLYAFATAEEKAVYLCGQNSITLDTTSSGAS